MDSNRGNDAPGKVSTNVLYPSKKLTQKVKNIAVAYTLCLSLKKDEQRANKIKTIAKGYSNINTGTAY